MAVKQGGYPFFRSVLGSPRYIVAPMVDQSELAWRQLSRRYGAHLCYTPMINSAVYIRSETYRESVFSTCEGDRPLIAQLCGNDPNVVLEAAQMLAPHCDAVDLNLGCPQNIARRGRYGAFLQDEWETISAIVKLLHEKLTVPVTCKIRVFEDQQRSIDYAKMLESSGCQLLTVHGRTRDQKGQKSGLASWETIKAIKETLSIPVIANGNILYLADVEACIRETGVDGVMTSETHLCNPAIFKGTFPHVCDMADEYIQLAIESKHRNRCIRAHLFRLWHLCLKGRDHLRDKLAKSSSPQDMLVVSNELRAELAELEREHPELEIVSREDDFQNQPASCKPEFAPLNIAPWRLQPRIRDHAKDAEYIEQSKEQARVDKEKAAKKHRSPAEEAEIRELAKKRKEERFPKCHGCHGNPLSLKCEHKRCRQCCKAHCISYRLNCESHKQNFAPKNDQPDTDEAAASKKAKLVTDPAESAEQDVDVVAADDINEGRASNAV